MITPSSSVGNCLQLDSAHLSDDRFRVFYDADTIEEVCQAVGADPEDVTGLAACFSAGNYAEVWVAQSARPFDSCASYERVF